MHTNTHTHTHKYTRRKNECMCREQSAIGVIKLTNQSTASLTQPSCAQVPAGATWLDLNIRSKLGACTCAIRASAACGCICNIKEIIRHARMDLCQGTARPIHTYIHTYIQPHANVYSSPPLSPPAVDTSDTRLMVVHCQQLRPHEAHRDAHMLVRAPELHHWIGMLAVHVHVRLRCVLLFFSFVLFCFAQFHFFMLLCTSPEM